ncbi:phosphate/phosphite/phosphonate ABC transporter substrate-binding protein [Vibrio sp. WXL210]|uniref:phosphate/phosphite/phosphonate ABC transporter substrate-binding protein n=1 Tax=Vibrio sp. WXL210 TaxID=3450709 RepID=UPI003EC89AED
MLLLIFNLAAAHAEPARVLTFGVVPQQSAAKLAQSWQPLIKRWGELANIDIKFATARDIPTFEQRLAAGEYDIAYMNPYHFTLFNRAPGYTALARAKDKRIEGILVARQDWQGELSDLNQVILAFPAPRAFAATIVNQSELKQFGIDFEAKYVGSHDSVYLGVAKGLYRAGGGVARTFNSLAPEVRSQLKIIHRTQAYTPHAIAIANAVDPVIQQALSEAIEALNQDATAKQSFDSLNIPGLQPAVDSDWQDIVELNIEL